MESSLGTLGDNHVNGCFEKIYVLNVNAIKWPSHETSHDVILVMIKFANDTGQQPRPVVLQICYDTQSCRTQRVPEEIEPL